MDGSGLDGKFERDVRKCPHGTLAGVNATGGRIAASSPHLLRKDCKKVGGRPGDWNHKYRREVWGPQEVAADVARRK